MDWPRGLGNKRSNRHKTRAIGQQEVLHIRAGQAVVAAELAPARRDPLAQLGAGSAGLDPGAMPYRVVPCPVPHMARQALQERMAGGVIALNKGSSHARKLCQPAQGP